MTPRALDRPEDEHRVRRYRVGDAAASDHMAEPSPRVYLTFGSEAAGIGFFPDLYRAAVGSVVAGIADPSIDLLVSVGRAADPAALEPLPPGVRVERWVDQDEALSRVDVTVCHGGYGTVVGSLAAGVPLVVLPLFAADQWINAEAADRAGVAVALRGPEDIGQLGAAVARVLADESYGERARAIQSEIASMPGPSEAVGWIEAVAS
jgi:UDP:flavonoid glycosyltransferase YjiC (YdhE family)